MQKRLVIFAPNWLGDAVMALPSIAAVRRGFPAAAMAVAARPSIAPLFGLVPGVDATIGLEGRGWRQLGRTLASHGFDVALLLPNSMHAALVASAARIPERWGYRTQWRHPLLTRSVDVPSGGHQVEYYRHLVTALGCPESDREPRIALGDDVRRAGADLLMSHGWTDGAPLVAIAPGAAYGSAKRWPPERFAELASTLAADGVQTVMVGSAADSASTSAVARAFKPAIDLVGRTDLALLAGVFSHCRTVVTNDSGAMHLAAAAGTPVTAVFGPTRDVETRPIGADHAVITIPVWCRPCMLRDCPLDHRCLRGIEAATVVSSARRTL